MRAPLFFVGCVVLGALGLWGRSLEQAKAGSDPAAEVSREIRALASEVRALRQEVAKCRR